MMGWQSTCPAAFLRGRKLKRFVVSVVAAAAVIAAWWSGHLQTWSVALGPAVPCRLSPRLPASTRIVAWSGEAISAAAALCKHEGLAGADCRCRALDPTATFCCADADGSGVFLLTRLLWENAENREFMVSRAWVGAPPYLPSSVPLQMPTDVVFRTESELVALAEQALKRSMHPPAATVGGETVHVTLVERALTAAFVGDRSLCEGTHLPEYDLWQKLQKDCLAAAAPAVSGAGTVTVRAGPIQVWGKEHGSAAGDGMPDFTPTAAPYYARLVTGAIGGRACISERGDTFRRGLDLLSIMGTGCGKPSSHSRDNTARWRYVDARVFPIGAQWTGAVFHFLVEAWSRLPYVKHLAIGQPGVEWHVHARPQPYKSLPTRAIGLIGFPGYGTDPGPQSLLLEGDVCAREVIVPSPSECGFSSGYGERQLRWDVRATLGLDRDNSSHARPTIAQYSQNVTVIERLDASHRRFPQYKELMRKLAGRGLHVTLYGGTEKLSDVLRMFGRARCVAGVHGAGFSNLVAALPGARVFELMPDNCPPSFIGMAQDLGQEWYGWPAVGSCDSASISMPGSQLEKLADTMAALCT